MRLLLSLGIDAYLQGCLVATLNAPNTVLKSQSKTFIVNVERGIMDYIPSKLLDNYEFVSHDFYSTANELYSEHSIYELGEKLISKYASEAKLVITSKYHSAVLCLALGIPVIMIIENNYYKYSWIEKYIPIYEPKDYKNINWNPAPVIIPKAEKELMINIAKRRIQETYDKYYETCTLSEIRERVEIEEFEDIFYGNNAIEYIKNNWKKDISIEYSFWGATDTARKLNIYIHDNYPNARLVRVYDWSVSSYQEYREGQFMPEPLDNIEKNNDAFIFVTGNSASEAAEELFGKMGKHDDEYFLCKREVLSEEDLRR